MGFPSSISVLLAPDRGHGVLWCVWTQHHLYPFLLLSSASFLFLLGFPSPLPDVISFKTSPNAMGNGICPLNEVTLSSSCQLSKAEDVQTSSPAIPLSGTHNAEDLPHIYKKMGVMA